MRRRGSVFFFFTLPFVKAQPSDISDTLPSIEVSLAPPARPVSSVSSAIGDMDKTREIYEAAMMDNLREFRSSVLKSAENKIGTVIRSFVHASNSASLVDHGYDEHSKDQRKRVAFTEAMSVKVNVPALDSDHSSELLSGIRGLAQFHSDSDKLMFERAQSDMTALVDFVVAELAAALKRSSFASVKGRGNNAAFLERISSNSFAKKSLPNQANVKVVASDTSFPSMSTLVDNFASRQRIASDFARLTLNLMLIDMCKSLNQVIKRNLAMIK